MTQTLVGTLEVIRNDSNDLRDKCNMALGAIKADNGNDTLKRKFTQLFTQLLEWPVGLTKTAESAIAIAKEQQALIDHQASVITEWQRDMKGTLATLERERAEKASIAATLEAILNAGKIAGAFAPFEVAGKIPAELYREGRAILAKIQPQQLKPVTTNPATPALADQLSDGQYHTELASGEAAIYPKTTA